MASTYMGFGVRQRGATSARELGPQTQGPNWPKRIQESEAAVAEAFVGITTDGAIRSRASFLLKRRASRRSRLRMQPCRSWTC